MTFRIGDRIKESTVTTGTGTITLAGAATGFRAFSTICSDTDTIVYTISTSTGSEWECGLGTWATGGTLARTTVITSSNANAAVSFSSGSKDVYGDFLAEQLGTSNALCNGRLTLTSGLPVTTADVTAAGSIYWAPYLGGEIALFSGGLWQRYRPGELTYTISASSGSNYFLLLWNDAGTRKLVRSPAWTGDNTIGTGAGTAEYELFEGVYVNKVDITSGPLAREGRIVGGFRANGASLTEDSIANRLLYNLYNRQFRLGARVDSGNHTFNTLTRVWNAGTDTRVTWFQMFAAPVSLVAHCEMTVGTSNSFILPALNGAVAGAPAGGNDYGHTIYPGASTPHVKALDFALAGYNYADVYEYEFSGNNVTNSFGRTYVELSQ